MSWQYCPSIDAQAAIFTTKADWQSPSSSCHNWMNHNIEMESESSQHILLHIDVYFMQHPFLNTIMMHVF
jgi:hypothetical protein